MGRQTIRTLSEASGRNSRAEASGRNSRAQRVFSQALVPPLISFTRDWGKGVTLRELLQ